MQTELKVSGKNEMKYSCTHCDMSFHLEDQLQTHCATVDHTTAIMFDEGRDWNWRSPPQGYSSECYTLCETHLDGEKTENTCKYGAQCVGAHGTDELTEWKERFEYRQMKLQRASENKLNGKSYTEQLLERWFQSTDPEKIMCESSKYVVESHDCDLVTTVKSKTVFREWTFILESYSSLQAVALLQDTYRNHFFLKHILVNNGLQQVAFDIKPPDDQEWVSQAQLPVSQTPSPELRHRIKVCFTTNIYGTFRQSVVFDFGLGPVMVKHLRVDVIPSVTDCDKAKEIRSELILSSLERWNATNSNIVEFESSTEPDTVHDNEEGEDNLLLSYPAPCPLKFSPTHSTISEEELTRNNYRTRIHELLYLEELARYEEMAKYNVTAKLRLASWFLISPSGVAASTAKFAHNNELFALLQLEADVSEDTSAGRLILNNCSTLYLSTFEDSKSNDGKRTVYEAKIEAKSKNVIYLKLSDATVTGLCLKADTNVQFDVQFQLNRIPYCKWHYAIDRIDDLSIIFPDTLLEPIIPCDPKREEIVDEKKLNSKQKEAIVAIATPTNISLPPILVIGPFGTGKTYTLAQAIKQTLLQDNTRILVCSHSNSAADLYIKDYLHPYVEDGHTEAKPLRIYYRKRWVSSVHDTVQKYCVLDKNGSFRLPTLKEIKSHRIIVITLNISMFLSSVGLDKGYFTHIILDEAAQAMECEAIMPLTLASTNTRIVLAGDHMQLGPDVYSKFVKERNLHVSLLERLYHHYPRQFACKILLCENYRAHEAIIHFTSELFYDQKLVSKGDQPRHDNLYPLTFFTTHGEDVQDSNSTAFYNDAEIYEIVKRVSELKKNWPIAWGKFNEHSIGIMTPYSDQMFRIRSELRKRRMGFISVERVYNVQGKQYRAVFLSIVRTRQTCVAANNVEGDEKSNIGTNDVDYGFLSNSKLLNTAITRAQSLVAVVGDPVAMCSVGRCRKIWQRFIQICDENNSLNGITWIHLQNLLENLKLNKSFALNPSARDFVPGRHGQETYIESPQSLATFNNADIPPPPMRFTQPPCLSSLPVFLFPAVISLPQLTINSSRAWQNSPRTTTAPQEVFTRPLFQPLQKYTEEEIRQSRVLMPPHTSGSMRLVQNGRTDLPFVQNSSSMTPVDLPSTNMIVPNANPMGLQDQMNKMNIFSKQPFAMQHPLPVQSGDIRPTVDVNDNHSDLIKTQQIQQNNDRLVLKGSLPNHVGLEEIMSSQSKQRERPKFVTDNGCDFMGKKFNELLQSKNIRYKNLGVQRPTPIQQPLPEIPLEMNVPLDIGPRIPDDLNILIQQQVNLNGFRNILQGVTHSDVGGISEDMYEPSENQFIFGQQKNIGQIDHTPLYKRHAQPKPNENIELLVNDDCQALSPPHQGLSLADECNRSPKADEQTNSVDNDLQRSNNTFYKLF